MYQHLIRIKATCPKHPRYSPAREGAGAIRGGCPFCTVLAEIQLHASRVEKSARLFADLAETYQRQKGGAGRSAA